VRDWLVVREQDAFIQAHYSDFQLKADCGWFGIWEGTLKPINRAYRVRIIYYWRTLFDEWIWDQPYVSVQVIDPPIGALALAERRRLPHIYGNPHDPAMPWLCLYDPRPRPPGSASWRRSPPPQTAAGRPAGTSSLLNLSPPASALRHGKAALEADHG
jgi:hypothetical protein